MNDIAVIPLANGGFTVVDAADFAALTQFVWRRHPGGYAYRMRGRDPHRRALLMHQELLDLPTGQISDHKNRYKLDNTRRNLRPATPTQSAHNRGAQANNKSGFTGVSWSHKEQRWVAQLRTNGKSHWLGQYKAPELAAAAYNEAVQRLCGEFAVLNRAASE